MTGDDGGAACRQAHRIVVTTSLLAAGHVEAALEAFCQATLWEPAATDGSAVQLTGFAAEYPDQSSLAAALVAAAAVVGAPPPVADVIPEPRCDWLALNRETFRPFVLERFFISQRFEAAEAPAHTLALKIDPGLAFGTGRHASTAGCLLALTEPILTSVLRRPGAKPAAAILDLGCGSGILAIAAAKLWHRPVIATDIDRVAVDVATLNARQNHVGSLVHVVVANGIRHRLIHRNRPFRLILANILSRPLRRMASSVARVSSTGTALVLAGFIKEDAAAVAAIYAGHGFRRLRTITIDGWTTLLLVRC